MAHLPYPHGMASTKRIQNSIDYLYQQEDVSVRVLILRQGRVSLSESDLSGKYKGVEYVTIGQDIKPNAAAAFKGMKYFYAGMAYLKKHYQKGRKNIVYVYGYPSTDNLPMLLFGKLLGYKYIFDIVEDIRFLDKDSDIFARLKHYSALFSYKFLWMFADACLVITKHLYEKTRKNARGRFPVVMFPITVNMEYFDWPARDFHTPIRIFYGGTFATKDGVENLIEAFAVIGKNYDNVQLILSGRGSKDRMKIIDKMISESAYRERIEYKGYLAEEEFYPFLNDCDILCMTRNRSMFAHTGFPFKLGEYLATGKPVIASRVSDVNLYLEDKKNALVIEPGSVGAIVEAIKYLLDQPEQARRIGAAGKATAGESFDAERWGNKLHEILLSL